METDSRKSLVFLSQQLAEVVESTARHVVGIETGGRASASGVVLSPGFIVTTEHSLGDENTVRITLPDGQTGSAEVAGRDHSTDLALLKTGSPIPPLSSTTEVPSPGAIVLAVGRSIKNGSSATMGIVSLAGGAWRTWRGGKLDRLVRLDLRLHSGASGAAVVDATGGLIGIATAGLSRGSVIAIPLSTVQRTVAQLESAGHVRRGFIGVGLQPVRLPDHLVGSLGISSPIGLMVLSTEPGSPAETAGISLGDILVKAGDAILRSHEDLQAVLDGDAVGSEVHLSVIRGGQLAEMPVRIGERPQGRR